MKTCNRCKHYYITWDKNFPYGCRAMGFKSHETPSVSVYKSSGMECLLFVQKDGGKIKLDDR
jgi:hypothetical protein